MKLNIDNVLTKQNKTRYWLSKKIDVTYQNLAKLCNNETVSIRFEILEKLCHVLDCTPNDLFELEPKSMDTVELSTRDQIVNIINNVPADQLDKLTAIIDDVIAKSEDK